MIFMLVLLVIDPFLVLIGHINRTWVKMIGSGQSRLEC